MTYTCRNTLTCQMETFGNAFEYNLFGIDLTMDLGQDKIYFYFTEDPVKKVFYDYYHKFIRKDKGSMYMTYREFTDHVEPLKKYIDKTLLND